MPATENIVDIIKRISPTFDVEALLHLAGGHAWYIPKRDFDSVRQQIRADPCRDYRVISRRYAVSPAFVYEVWARP